MEGAREVYECAIPAAVTADKGLNEPRYASLKGIMAAKKKPIETKDLASLGLSADHAAARVKWTKLELPPPRPEGKIFKDDPVAAAKEVVRLLHDVDKLV